MTTSTLRMRILAAAGLVLPLGLSPALGCGEEATGRPSTGNECFSWPDAVLCEGTGGASAGTGGAGGEGGGIPACPTPSAAEPYLCIDLDLVISIEGGTFSDGKCCYDVTYGAGRPLLVDGAARVATTRSGAEWAGRATPSVVGLSTDARRAVAAAWTRAALLEHASVASFGRFAIELLRVGASPELVERAHRAALDEVRHAQACFALASAYAGEPIAPGALELPAALPLAKDLAALVEATVVEGCVGETLAAAEATAQLATATDPAVRSVLATIVEDETSHAELAWRTVAWAIGVGGEPVRAAARAAFARALRSVELATLPAGRPTEDAVALAQHGVLAPAERRSALVAAIEQIVRPASAGLLG